MFVSLVKKVLRAALVMLIVTFSTFTLMYGNAQGIGRAVAGMRASDEAVQARIHELGLDRPLLVQYWDWLTGALQGDLGRSFYTSEPVVNALGNRAPVTLSLTIITLILAALVAVILAVTAATRGGLADKVVQFLSVLGTAIPGFVIAIVLVFTFAVNLRWLPATGFTPIERGVGDWAASLVLPVTALMVSAVAGIAAQFRTAMLDTLGRDYVRTLRARGIGEREIIFRNVLRNAAAPGLSAISLTMVALIGGTVFIETVFALPGMGQMANQAAQTSDVPMVMGAVLVTIIVVLVVNLLADLGVTMLNPKARTR